MKNAFVYVIGWRTLDKWYCGVRYKRGCQPSDLWTLYFTSSKEVAKFRLEHGEPNIVKVMKCFGSDIMAARRHEQRLLTRFDVLKTSRWLNNAIGGHFAGRHGPHSEETKRKIGDKNRGKKHGPCSSERIEKQKATFAKNYTKERKQQRSEKQKGKPKSLEHSAKISKTLTGRSLPQAHKDAIGRGSKNQSAESREKQASKLRLKKWFTDGITSVRVETCPVGFRPGRKLMLRSRRRWD